jgi:nucleoside-diphosphate-sugar epimerase
VLVTGAAGFVGATLVRRLVASGYLVRVLDNLSTGDAAHLSGVDARRNEVPRVVLASTGGALIGDAVPPVDERSLPKPLSPYGASKPAGEGYAHAFAKTYGLRTVAVRFGNVYGPGAHASAACSTRSSARCGPVSPW